MEKETNNINIKNNSEQFIGEIVTIKEQYIRCAKNPKYRYRGYKEEKYYIHEENKKAKVILSKTIKDVLIEKGPLEKFIERNFIGYKKFRTVIKYSDIKQFIKINLFKEILHGQIILMHRLDNKQIEGTFIDYCIKKIIDKNSHEPKLYIKSSKEFNKINNDIKRKINRLNGINFIRTLLGDDIINVIKNEFLGRFNNVKIGKYTFNSNLKIYGIPDLIIDNAVIDIKVSDESINNVTNWMQLIYYMILLDKRIGYLYNPLKGIIYKIEIGDNKYKKLYKFIKYKLLDKRAKDNVKSKREYSNENSILNLLAKS